MLLAVGVGLGWRLGDRAGRGHCGRLAVERIVDEDCLGHQPNPEQPKQSRQDLRDGSRQLRWLLSIALVEENVQIIRCHDEHPRESSRESGTVAIRLGSAINDRGGRSAAPLEPGFVC